jgi:HKD family nuclease
MVSIRLLNPLDQPIGRHRLLADLKVSLLDENFNRFRFVVAFAKVGPLLRLKSIIEKRRAAGFRIEAIFGVDLQGTSAQALAFALEHFNSVYVTREASITFHPKIYAFQGKTNARVFVGSNNLTVGGTETNFESAICLDLILPDDSETNDLFKTSWDEMLPSLCPATKKLDRRLLSQLISDGTVPDETVMRNVRVAGSGASQIPKTPRSGLKLKPPSALPARKVVKPALTPPASSTQSNVNAIGISGIAPYSAQGLAIQIKPHHNGEIFLSVTAALQNPSFFQWPFNGQTIPKKGSNKGYPQLTPDPRINATVYGAQSEPILTLQNYPLNTVYYEKNSEIRITASPFVSVVPDYSVMIMKKSEIVGVDYEIIIHTPDSSDYGDWIGACNQKMPGGGSTPRKFGWF